MGPVLHLQSLKNIHWPLKIDESIENEQKNCKLSENVAENCDINSFRIISRSLEAIQ